MNARRFDPVITRSLAALLAIAGGLWLSACQPLSAVTPGPQIIVSPAAAPADAWDHGAGQRCTDCHARTDEAYREFDWRTVPDAPDSAQSAEGEEEGEGPVGRMSFFVQQRAYPGAGLPEGARTTALNQAQAMARILAQSQAAPAARWESIGPAPMKNSAIGQSFTVDVSGRVKALAVDPRNSNVVYLGAAQGGVWKTTNGGASWQPLTDDQPSLAIGALAIDPQHPDTIYAGTGEPTPGLDNYYGAGILKTTDAGASWVQVGAAEFGGMGISAITVNPRTPNVVHVASARSGVTGAAKPVRGIFRSNNGGATWTALLTCQDCMGASDLVMDPQNPDTLYVAFWSHGIYKSTDGGAHWTQLTSGLPPSNYLRVELAIAASDPAVLYAGYHYRLEGQYDGALVFKTTNGGASWTQLRAPNYCTGQCWYDNVIAVDPADANVVYLGGSANYEWQPVRRIKEVVIKSSDGGATWFDMSPNTSADTSLHPDMHAIAFDSQNYNTVWIGNDGGVWRSTDAGRTWINRNTNLATLQFTGIAIHPTNSQIVFGGMQDNNKAKTSGPLAWDALDVGDGGYAAIDPFNPQYFYGSRYGISFQRNDKGGSAAVEDWPMKIDGIDRQDRALFYAPFAVDPARQGVIYYGTHRLYRSTNRGDSWSAISGDLSKGQGSISAIAVAAAAAGAVYVGASDGNVQVTTNNGAAWTNVTKAPLPNRWVSDIAVVHNDARTAYVVFNGFNTHTPGAPGHVFKTADGGGSWRNISSNLPDAPALSIALDRDAAGALYIGTDVGVFRSLDDGASWQPFGDGLPNVAVVDLALNPDADTLVAGTHGRSVWRIQIGATPLSTRTPTPTSTPTRPPLGSAAAHLPLVVQRFGAGPPATPTRTPSATASPSGTPTPTVAGTQIPTRTPTATATRTPTATEGPTPTRTHTPGGPTSTATRQPSPRVFFDDFGNPASGWQTGTVGNCQSGYVGGEFGVAATAYNQVCLYPAPTGAHPAGVYEVKGAKSGLFDGSVYGLMFGLKDKTDFSQLYVFWVDPADQTYLLQKYQGGSWSNLTDVSYSWAIALGASANTLKVHRDGGRIALFINGAYLMSVDDNSFPANGYVGVANWAAYSASSALTYFDDFKVSKPTLVFVDDFSNPHGGWPAGALRACQASYDNGEYRTATQADYACVYRSPAGRLPSGLFEVMARREESIYPTAYGVLLGEDGSFSRAYVFWVNPDSREYVLALFDGVWRALTWDEAGNDAWTYSPAINPGTANNTLRVRQDGPLISLWVNDVYLETVTDATFAGGYFGVANWASDYAPATSAFDDFRVTAWEEPALSAGDGIQPGPGAQSVFGRLGGLTFRK